MNQYLTRLSVVTLVALSTLLFPYSTAAGVPAEVASSGRASGAAGGSAMVPTPTGERADGKRGPAVQPILEEDPRLQMPVTLRISRRKLSEVVEELARRVNVGMSASPDVADESVVLHVTDRPARELMHQLATLFTYRWRRRGPADAYRYELYQDLSSKQEEASLRRECYQRALTALQDALRRRLALALQPAAPLREQLAADEAALAHLEQVPEEQRLAAEQTPGVAAIVRRASERHLLRDAADPVRRALLGLLADLSTAHWNVLLGSGVLRFSTQDEPGAAPLSSQWASELLEAAVGSGSAVRAEGLRLTVRLNVKISARGAQAALSATAMPLAADRTSAEAGSIGTLMVVGSCPPPVERASPTDASGSSKKEPLLEKKCRLGSLQAVAGEDSKVTLDQLLLCIASASGVDLIADVDRDEAVPIEAPSADAAPTLRELLDQYVSTRASWIIEGGCLRVRRRA